MLKKLSRILTVTAILLSSKVCFAGLKPDVINFDMDYEALNGRLNDYCSRIEERKIEPLQIPETRDSQVQIDCYDFHYEGKSRLAEFVFRDGQLILVWILTDKSEENKFEKKLTAEYGGPSHTTSGFTAFTAKHAALRKDKPEVLFYNPVVSGLFEAWFANPK